MNRSGYSDDCDNNWDLIKWRGQVASSIRGKRGQAFLHELLVALDAMPDKRLITDELQSEAGVCALGCVGARRGLVMTDLDPEDSGQIAWMLGIANPLVCEIEWVNDEAALEPETPEQRWQRVRRWVVDQLR